MTSGNYEMYNITIVCSCCIVRLYFTQYYSDHTMTLFKCPFYYRISIVIIISMKMSLFPNPFSKVLYKRRIKRKYCCKLLDDTWSTTLQISYQIWFTAKNHYEMGYGVSKPATNYRRFSAVTSEWRHNDRNGVPNHQPYDCLLNRLFRRKAKKISKLCVTGLCAANSPVTGECPAQRVNDAEKCFHLMTWPWWCFGF